MRYARLIFLRTALGTALWTLIALVQADNFSWCGTLMCVNATTNDNIITYELQSLNQLGWMSIGFGAQMNDTPLVIVWPNDDGSITLSQRQAVGHNPPVPVASPPRTATISQNTDLSDSTSPILAFDIALRDNEDLDSEAMIWAYGVTRPDPNPDADLVQHLDAGSFVLAARKHDGEGDGDEDDGPSSSSLSSSTGGASSMTSAGSLTAAPQPTPTQTLSSSPSNSLSSISSTNSSSSSLSSEPSSSSSSPLPTQLPDTASPTRAHHIDTLIAAHASLSFLGFAVFLPLAALITRWSRTFTAYWFRIHWLTIAVFGAPCMLVGWVLGPLLVSRQGHRHVVNEHQIGGVALFALVLVQISLGTLIHLLQPKDGNSKAHPPRNVFHVALGLFIIGFAFFEAKTGITRDWSLSQDAKKVLTIFCILWALVVAAAYLIGLLFLRKQFHQERLGWHLPLASRTQTRSSHPISEGSTNRSQLLSTTTISSSGRPFWRLGSRADDGTRESVSHHTAVSSSVPEIRPEASMVTLVEMRELQSTLPISVRAREAIPPCSSLVD